MSPTDTSEPRLDALIIGCGGIAGAWEEKVSTTDDHDPQPVLTHARAYLEHTGFRLIGCVEPDEARRNDFMNAFGLEAGWPDLASCDRAYDVASLCAPTRFHGALLQELVQGPAKAVLCEKPLCGDAQASARAVAAFGDAGKGLAVNYSRRFDPAMRELAAQVASHQWGRLLQMTGWYGKGLVVNGSHMIDLARLLGGPLSLQSVDRVQPGWADDDPLADLRFAGADGAPVRILSVATSASYSLFELDLVFEDARITIEDAGFTIRLRKPIQNRFWPGYAHLNDGRRRATNYGWVMAEAIDNLYRHVTQGDALACSGADALAVEETLAEILSKIATTPGGTSQ